MMQPIQIEGYTPRQGQGGPSILYNHVSVDFFKTLRTPIVRGRPFVDPHVVTEDAVSAHALHAELAVRDLVVRLQI